MRMRSRRPWQRVALIGFFVCGAALAVLRECNRLPPLGNRLESHAMTGTDTTAMGRIITPPVAAHAPYSGIYPLRDAHDAFAARMRMAETAERSLDVQYYIWHKDLSGTMLASALHAAADRGVRVRLLLDDNNTSGLDEAIAALDSHPNIEVRLFNPFALRKLRFLGYLTSFGRLNRRMHNKSFTADNQATIVGGRNVGDEYFGATDGVIFADLDLLAVGPVVHEVSAEFDRYWSSASAYPAAQLIPAAPRETLQRLTADAARIEKSPAAIAYMNALRASSFVHLVNNRALPLEWGNARVISDDPDKVIGRARSGDLVAAQLKMIFGEPAKSVDLVSPYFVPGSEGTDMFRRWAQRGVKVRVLTNSLEATDVPAVHAGYAKRRQALVESGITVYELRQTSSVPASGLSTGSSSASLHAKTFAVDTARVFVGSFNFDPRSAKLNTEMGFVVDSPALAKRMKESFDQRIPFNSYEVRLSTDHKLEWIDHRNGQVVRLTQEPGATFWKRATVWFLSHLPIEWLL